MRYLFLEWSMDDLTKDSKNSHTVVIISRHWNLLFHLPFHLLLPTTFFNMFNARGGQLNCRCVD
jgi:hypothetical protein